MVSPLSKLANPWKCDAPGCGQLRAKDTNHWLIIEADRGGGCVACESGEEIKLMPTSLSDSTPVHKSGIVCEKFLVSRPQVRIWTWDDAAAERPGAKHVCGVPCALKTTAVLVMQTFFPAEISTGKEVVDGD